MAIKGLKLKNESAPNPISSAAQASKVRTGTFGTNVSPSGGGGGNPIDKYFQSAMGAGAKASYSLSPGEIQAQQDFDAAEAAIGRQAKGASDFRKNLEGYQGAQEDILSGNLRKDLASNLADTRASASRRGLLFSGIREGAEQGLRSQYLQDLSGGRADINAQSVNKAREFEDQAKEAGVNLQQQRQALADAIYAQQMAQFEGQKERLQGKRDTLLQSIGSAASLLGKAAR